MKKMLSFFIGILSIVAVQAQSTGSRLPLKVYVADMPQPFPANAKTQLMGKISQMLTSNGIASTDTYSDFWITALATPLDKQIVPGSPVQIIQELEFTFYIIDAKRQIVFSSESITSKGVCTSEAKCYADAIKRVNTKASVVSDFISKGRNKIISYYDVEADNIFAKARQLALSHCYEEALFLLCTFPTECSRYAESIGVGNDIYKAYVDFIAQKNLAQAKALWVAEQNASGAAAAGVYLSEILPDAACYQEAVELYNEIKAKVHEDWVFEMKRYQDGVDLEQQRIAAWQEVGVAYGNNQQPSTTNLAWLK